MSITPTETVTIPSWLTSLVHERTTVATSSLDQNLGFGRSRTRWVAIQSVKRTLSCIQAWLVGLSKENYRSDLSSQPVVLDACYNQPTLWCQNLFTMCTLPKGVE